MDNRNRKHFKFYTKEYKDLFNLISIRQQHKLLMSIIDYVESGLLPVKLNTKTMMVFSAIKPIIDGDIEYERIRQERIKAGVKGNRIRTENAKKRKSLANYSKSSAK